mgnify:CR=1 FL=1
MAKAKKLSTPTDLKGKNTRSVADALNGILADSFALYLKTKNFHWHVSGPHFRDYHLMLDAQAAQFHKLAGILDQRLAKSAWVAGNGPTIAQGTVFTTSGFDGALVLAAKLRGEEVAQGIQLYMQYDPHPPFDSGTPETAPAALVAATRQAMASVISRREATIAQIAAGFTSPAAAAG